MWALQPTRVVIGRDVQLLGRQGPLIMLQSGMRLRPGQRVEIVPADPGEPHGIAVVETWTVGALLSTGPAYRGSCRLESAAGTRYPAGGSLREQT
jgi:hypothetical protein